MKQFVYLLFFYFFFVNWSNISFFPIVGKKTCNKWVLENQCKWMNYRVSANFNRLNWNPIMTMFFIYVESFITSLLPKHSFNTVLCHMWYFRRQNTTFWNRWALFCKKELKAVTFLLKICNKFINNKQRKYGKSFFTIVKSFQYRPVIVRTPPLEGGRIWKSRKRGAADTFPI